MKRMIDNFEDEEEENQPVVQKEIKKKKEQQNSVELDDNGDKQVGMANFSLRQTALTAQKIQQMMDKYKKQ